MKRIFAIFFSILCVLCILCACNNIGEQNKRVDLLSNKRFILETNY
jgi:hypothetical protein